MGLYLQIEDTKVNLDKWLKFSNKMPKSIKKLINKHKKEVKIHFEEDGYSLNADYIIDDIIDEFFGFDIRSEILFSLICTKEGLEAVYEDNWKLCLSGESVFMSEKGDLYVSKSYKNINDTFIGGF